MKKEGKQGIKERRKRKKRNLPEKNQMIYE